MADPVEVTCSACRDSLWIAHVGFTFCPCGVRHYLVPSEAD